MMRSGSTLYVGFGALIIILLYTLFLYSSLKTSLQHTQNDLDEVRRQKIDASVQLFTAKDNLERLQNQLDESKRKSERLEDDARNQKRRKDEEIRKSDGLQVDLTQARASISKSQTELRELRSELSASLSKSQAELKELRDESSRQLTECNERNDRQVQLYDTLQESKKQAATNYTDAQNKSYREIENLKLEIKTLHETIEQLNLQLLNLSKASNSRPVISHGDSQPVNENIPEQPQANYRFDSANNPVAAGLGHADRKLDNRYNDLDAQDRNAIAQKPLANAQEGLAQNIAGLVKPLIRDRVATGRGPAANDEKSFLGKVNEILEPKKNKDAEVQAAQGQLDLNQAPHGQDIAGQDNLGHGLMGQARGQEGEGPAVVDRVYGQESHVEAPQGLNAQPQGLDPQNQAPPGLNPQPQASRGLDPQNQAPSGLNPQRLDLNPESPDQADKNNFHQSERQGVEGFQIHDPRNNKQDGMIAQGHEAVGQAPVGNAPAGFNPEQVNKELDENVENVIVARKEPANEIVESILERPNLGAAKADSHNNAAEHISHTTVVSAPNVQNNDGTSSFGKPKSNHNPDNLGMAPNGVAGIRKSTTTQATGLNKSRNTTSSKTGSTTTAKQVGNRQDVAGKENDELLTFLKNERVISQAKTTKTGDGSIHEADTRPRGIISIDRDVKLLETRAGLASEGGMRRRRLTNQKKSLGANEVAARFSAGPPTAAKPDAPKDLFHHRNHMGGGPNRLQAGVSDHRGEVSPDKDPLDDGDLLDAGDKGHEPDNAGEQPDHFEDDMPPRY